MLEALRKKREEKEKKMGTERYVLFTTTVKRRGGFVGEETTWSDGAVEMKVITPSSEDSEVKSTKPVLCKFETIHPIANIPFVAKSFFDKYVLSDVVVL
jgi:hypothetical protein